MLDIEGFVHRNFDRVVLYGNPTTDLRVDCPFCEDRYGKIDVKQKLYVSLEKHVVHCFKCGYKQNWISFVMDVLHCTYYQALGELHIKPNPAKLYKLYMDNDPTILKPTHFSIDTVGIWETEGCKYLSAGRKYATNRGLSEEHWALYNLSVSDELPYRLIIPIEENYYQARAFYGWQEPKYLNPNIPSENFLFNSGALFAYKEVVICEGAISAYHVGLNAIATLGVDVTKQQVRRMLESPVERFNIAFDAGTAQQSVDLADKLAGGGKEVTIWKFEDGDPADNVGGYKEYEYTFRNKVELLLNC